MTNNDHLMKTPLHPIHIKLGARMTPFDGWDMPLQYSGILDEARTVRSHTGVFDVSHMGRLEIVGTESTHLLNRILSSDITTLQTGRSRYTLMCNTSGGIIDDCILYKLSNDRFMLVPNAANTETVLKWIYKWKLAKVNVKIRHMTNQLAMLAIQGPSASEILSHLTTLDLSTLRSYQIVETNISGVEALLARTGYTGEDGFELIFASGKATRLWVDLIDLGGKPCGLGARDILRLEAGLPLHGNEIDVDTNPYESNLERFVEIDRPSYIAGGALQRIKAAGTNRKLVGFTMTGRGVARHGYRIMHGLQQIGAVTSGSYSPTLDTNIGMGYVPTASSSLGSQFRIDVRGRSIDAEVTALPFYSRKKHL